MKHLLKHKAFKKSFNAAATRLLSLCGAFCDKCRGLDKNEQDHPLLVGCKTADFSIQITKSHRG